MFPLFIGTTHSLTVRPPLYLYNTLSRSKERFVPLSEDVVRMYTCGPTVYDYAHIGNLRSYVFADILRRTLLLNGYKVKQVMNVTDIGHLTSDGDTGDDKMMVGLKREGLPYTLEGLRSLADTYTDAFLDDLDALLIKRPAHLPRASEHIKGQIALIETLMEKEYAYRTSDGVYFDVSRFKDYGKLGGIRLEGQESGARVAVHPEKRNGADFALWKRSETVGWDSPWGKGFPGWHIECSAMSMEYLGRELDIHTGGVDHIGTHHNNEIAQSEAATGRTFVRYFLHNEHLNIEGTKISKSLGNSVKLRQLVEHGYSPLAYRYLLLTSHYRTQMNFSFAALDAAQTALKRLQRYYVEELDGAPRGRSDRDAVEALTLALNDDLDTPKALALLSGIVKDHTLKPASKRATLKTFDRVLGLGLHELELGSRGLQSLAVRTDEPPTEVQHLVEERERVREARNFARADELRAQILAAGYQVVDTAHGPTLERVSPVIEDRDQ